MLSFVFGFSIFENFSSVAQRQFSLQKLKRGVLSLTKSRVLYILYGICVVFASKFAIKALLLAQMNSGTLAGDDRGELIFEGSYLYKFFYHFIMNPLYYVTLSLISVVLFAKIRNRKIFCILSILFLIASIVLSGGRSKFVIIAMYFLLTYLCCTKNLRKQFFNLKRILGTFTAIVVIMVAMSLQTGYRSTGKYSLNSDNFIEAISSMGETFGIYSVIPIRLFDYSVEKNYFDQFEGPKYGRAVFAGSDGIVMGLIRRFSGNESESTLRIVDYLQDNGIYIIPGNHPYNYCYTALFFCYMDFGILGVIILPFLFGSIFRYYIFQFYKTSSLPSFILIGFGYFMMMHSLFQDYFVKNWTLPFCIIMASIQYIIYTKKLRISLRNI